MWSILGIALVVIITAGAHLGANLEYDDARTEFADAETIATNRQSDLTDEIESLSQDAGFAAEIAAADSGALMPAESRAALDASLTDVDATMADAMPVATEDLPDAGEKPMWTWELYAESARLRDDAAQAETTADDVDAQRQAVSDAGTSLEDASVTAVRASAAAAGDFEAAHVNARNPEIVEMRSTAAYTTSSVASLDENALAQYRALESAAASMLETEQAELDEKKGGLHDSRVAIEEFARGLAPGVLLDFDWSTTVKGYDGPSNGGWTTWWYGDPGYATVALSDYVAEQWPAAWTKALVAHEVGHAISVKCESLYDSSSQDTIEEWATAWAISMGYTDRNNGTAVYGAPSQAMIDAASKCR